MIILQKAMEKTHLYTIDEFGVKNYRYAAIGFTSFFIFFLLNIVFGYITYLAEASVIGSPVQSFSDAIWLMVMSSSTIGFGDVYPITLLGRSMVFIMFILGVGILGGVGAIFANKIFGFADTNVKNRELRKQNNDIYQKLLEIEKRIEQLDK